jgi:hypothetical protein
MVSFLCFLVRLCSARPPPRAPIQHIEIGDRLRIVKGKITNLDKDLLSLFHSVAESGFELSRVEQISSKKFGAKNHM